MPLLLRSGLLLLWLLPWEAMAQTDTTVARLREVQIFGQQVKEYAAGSRVETIDTAFLRLRNAANLGDILQSRSPLAVRTYGPGQLASVSFRGTAARHTAVLWNGLNINLPTLGQTDLSLIPVAANAEVALQHGGAGANYGSGAIGGTILLSSPPAWDNRLRASLQQDVGSYGHSFSNLHLAYSRGKVAGATGLYRGRADNNFPFRNVTRFGAPLERQENAGVQQQGFTQDLHYRLNDHTHLSVRGWYAENDAQAQPAMGSTHANARRDNQSLRLLGDLSGRRRSGTWSLKTAWFKDRMQYRTDNISSDTDVDTYQTQAEYAVRVGQKLRVKGGAEAQHFRALVDGYDQPVQENRASGFLLVRYDPTPRLDLSLNVRQGLVQGYNPPLTPSLGLNLRLRETQASTLTAKGNLAQSYRVPTLNERFWPTGDPDLKPESGRSLEAGLQHEHRTGSLQVSAEITGYSMWVDHWVNWEPSGPNGAWSPRNIRQVQVQGAELSGDLRYAAGQTRAGLGIRYSYTRSVHGKTDQTANQDLVGKQLIYVPRHNGSLFLNFTLRRWLLTSTLSYAGYRYTREDNTAWLPPFALLQVVAGREFSIGRHRFQGVGTVHNLTNITYQTMQYFAMPPRHYSLSLRYHFTKQFN